VKAVNIKFKRLKHGAKAPVKAFPGDLCYDIFAPDDYVLLPGNITPIPTGIAIEPEPGYGIVIRDKSSMAVRKITVHGGEIDNAYRGEIKVLMFNHNDTTVSLPAGMKIAQLRVVKSIDINFEESFELSDTERGDGGFGSTGKF